MHAIAAQLGRKVGPIVQDDRDAAPLGDGRKAVNRGGDDFIRLVLEPNWSAATSPAANASVRRPAKGSSSGNAGGVIR